GEESHGAPAGDPAVRGREETTGAASRRAVRAGPTLRRHRQLARGAEAADGEPGLEDEPAERGPARASAAGSRPARRGPGPVRRVGATRAQGLRDAGAEGPRPQSPRPDR